MPLENILTPNTCRVCQAVLNRHQAIQGICDSPECRHGDAPFQLAKRERSIRTNIERLADRTWPTDSGRTAVIVPVNLHTTEALPQKRRDAFERHLREIVQQAVLDSEKGIDTAPDRLSPRNGISDEHARSPLAASFCGY